MIKKVIVYYITLYKLRLKNTLIGNLLISLRDIIRFGYWSIKRSIQVAEKYRFDYKRIYWIRPGSVRFRSKRMRQMKEDLGKVIGGDWDLWAMTWENHDEVRWLKERFVEGKKWEDTELYCSILRYINKGVWISPYNDNPNHFHFLVDKDSVTEEDDYFGNMYTTKVQLDKRCKELDELYESIVGKGMLPMESMVNKKLSPLKAQDNVVIDIGRDGDLLFCDGKHRFTIANILDIEKIPVIIGKRHRLWLDFRTEITSYLIKHGKVYQPLTHIDLMDFPSSHSSYRFDIIKDTLDSLGLRSGSLLDIGANWGYFSIKFEEIGFNCTAVENDQESLYFMRKLRRAENRHFEIVDSDIFDYENKTSFDIVLAVGIFHHFIKTESFLNQLIDFLGKINMEIMFFQSHVKGESTMKNSYKDFEPVEFTDFILKYSCLNNTIQIGVEPETGRPIFMLTK